MTSKSCARMVRRVGTAIMLTATAFALAGCDRSRVADEMHPMLTDYTKRHPIGIADDSVLLDLPPVTGDPADRSRDTLAAMRFMHKYKQEGRGPLVVSVAASDRRQWGVERRVDEVRRLARVVGVPTDRMRFTGRSHPRSIGAAVTLSYERLAVVAPICGDWSENVTRNPDNLPYPNYGCASQRNLAAMIANPTDVVFPAQETPRLSDNRAAAYAAYKGKSGEAGPSSGGGGASPSGATPAASK